MNTRQSLRTALIPHPTHSQPLDDEQQKLAARDRDEEYWIKFPAVRFGDPASSSDGKTAVSKAGMFKANTVSTIHEDPQTETMSMQEGFRCFGNLDFSL